MPRPLVKFVVEAYVKSSIKWDEESGTYVNCAPYLYNPLGSEYCVIIHDLKTLRGVKNRIRKFCWSDRVVEIRIYSTTEVLDRETYKLEYTIIRSDNNG